MPCASLPLLQSHQPLTFRERGVALPFTTPALASARARLVDEHDIEVLVPNPSGGRGVYVLDLSRCSGVYRATIHDARLVQSLFAAVRLGRALTPALLRQVARGVAREGFAGRLAAQAANAAAKDAIAAEAAIPEPIRIAMGDQPEPMRAELVGAHVDLVAADDPDHRQDRLSRMLGALTSLAPDIRAWAAGNAGPAAGAATAIAVAAQVTATLARRALTDTQAFVSDPPTLAAALRADPADVAARLARPAWLLDGWERLCLLWRTAPSLLGRFPAVLEMAAALPVIPAEIEMWLDLPSGFVADTRRRDGAYRASTPQRLPELISRNEHLLALAA